MSDTGSSTSLFGDEPAPAQEQPPSLMEQVTGVFTEPAALFTRLHRTPVWGQALILLSLLNTAVAVVWALRVDVDAMIRPILERNPKIPVESYDTAIAIQSRMILPFSILGGLLGLGVITLVMALIYWIIGQWTAEAARPSYRQTFSALVVSSLVGLPKFILLGIICGLRNFGGAKPDALSPTALGFYLAPDSLRLQALYNSLDLFTFASLLMTYLAARHAMRLKVSGALVCVAIAAALMFGMPLLGAR